MDNRYNTSRQHSHPTYPTSPNYIAPATPNTYQQPRSPTSVPLQQQPPTPNLANTPMPSQGGRKEDESELFCMYRVAHETWQLIPASYMQSQGGSNNNGNRTNGALNFPHASPGVSPQFGVAPRLSVPYPASESPLHISPPTANSYQQRCVKSAPLQQQPSASYHANVPKPSIDRRNTF